LCIDDTSCSTKKSSNVSFNLHVYVLSAVEARWTTRSNTICAKSLDGPFLEVFVGYKVVKVV
jgi:hypothetical protein